MHRALALSDILDNVFLIIADRDPRYRHITGGHVLVQSSLVCKMWSDLALDHLWRHVGLYQLRHLFTALCSRDSASEVEDSVTTFVRTIDCINPTSDLITLL